METETLQQLTRLLWENTAAWIGLAGVLAGSVLTLVIQLITTRRRAAFRVQETIIEKRIEAHEAVMLLVKELRETSIPDLPSARTYDDRIPKMLVDFLNGTDWRQRFAHVTGSHLHWLDRELREELLFVQNYLINLFEAAPGLSEKQLIRVGRLAREDLISLAKRLEDMALDFFEEGAKRFRFRRASPDQKVDPAAAEERLRDTNVGAELFGSKGS